jgi:hypothetical protein
MYNKSLKREKNKIPFYRNINYVKTATFYYITDINFLFNLANNLC